MRRLDELLTLLAARGEVRGADRLLMNLDDELSGVPLVAVTQHERRGAMVSTKQRPAETHKRRRLPSPAIGLAAFAIIVGAAGLLVSLLPGAGSEVVSTEEAVASGTAEPTVGAEIQQQITALIDDYLTAWTNADGLGVLSSMTADGRYVGRRSGLEGWSGEELKTQVEQLPDGIPWSRDKTRTPLIVERRDSYLVVQTWQPYESGTEYIAMFNVVDENGTLKIRYTEDWTPLGWFRLADDLPYRPIGGGNW